MELNLQQIDREALGKADQLGKAGKNALDLAETFQIDCQEMYQVAQDELKNIKHQLKEIEETERSMTRPLDAFKKQIKDYFRPAIDVRKKVIDIYNRKMGEWYDKVEAERRRQEEEARKAREEAERKAREEQERVEAERRRQEEEDRRAQEEARRAEEARRRAEQAKSEAERRRQEEEARKAREAARKAEEEARKAEEEARKAQEEAIKAEEAALAPVETEIPEIKHVRKNYSAEVVDEMALIRAVAEGKEKPGLVVANTKALNAQARALKEMFNITGCKLVVKKSQVSK